MDSPMYSSSHSGRDRSFVSQPSRAPSRASNSTASTRVTSHSTGNSSYTTSSPKQTISSSTLSSQQRLSQVNGSRKPPPSHLSTQLMMEAGYEARQSPISSYLQEKLLRERKVELDNKSVSSGRTSNDAHTQGSPCRREGFDPRRPMSSGGPDAPTKKKGMGVKEMEQTVSTLHKQNFDLKLELYHRRERQTALEDELTRMKDDSAQLTELNDRLVEELEKRDKAVEEAVAMIVLLEAQVETLLKEREMVRRIETQTPFGHMSSPLNDARATTPKPLSRHTPQHSGDFASLQRMPSFLSEQSQTTENLRNVYLGAKGGSLLSLLRPTETPVDIEHERLASPSLSVLSESSFVSVYGKHNGQDGDMTITQFDERPTLETHSPGGASVTRPRNGPIREWHSREGMGTPSRSTRTNSLTRAAQYPPLTDMLDQNSPLQRLEKMDRTYSLKTTSSQQSGRDREAEYQRAAGAPTTLSRTASQRRTKEQKREALKKVMTDAPGRLRDQNMPPTPDTISTTTLRHYQNSADTLSQQQGLAHQQSYLTLSETNSVPSLDAQPGPRARTVIPANFAVAQPPSMTAFHSRRDAPRSSYFDNRPPIIQRPRSADETTTSHRKDNGWDSDSEEDESDANSMASSLDIWMKDSWKPAKSYGNGGRRSPDLFGFPAKGVTGLTSPWSPEAIFNAAFAKPSTTGGGGINSALDGLVPAETALFGSGVPPPPPHRRSSLHAQTGSTSASAMLDAMNRSETSARGWGRKPAGGKRGHMRRNSDDVTAGSTISQSDGAQQETEVADGKESRKDGHYPPITGQQNRGRGLNRFFRRSIGSASYTDSAPPSATEPTFPAGTSAPKTAGIGIPSWIHRSSVVDDERSGATPPPIMRNRAPSKGEMDDEDRYEGGASLNGPPVDDGAVGGAGAPLAKGTANGDPGTRRKWLPGFGRSSGPRTKT